MILIADSGSTKTAWSVAENGNLLRQVETAGMNPYYQTPEEIRQVVEQNLLPGIKDFPLEAVWFYGAGCTVAEKKQALREAMRALKPARIEVESDMLGAARAVCKRQAGIACILGTGSNSCFYDGEKIVKNIPPLGYILGDEGSGAVLGKLFVADCLKGKMPGHLIDTFMQHYRLRIDGVLEQVYKQAFPNRFLASFAPFLKAHIGEAPVYDLVYQSFRSFFIRNVMQYEHFDRYPVYFCGSVAFHFQQVLREAARSAGIEIEKIEQSPMNGLLDYHHRPGGPSSGRE